MNFTTFKKFVIHKEKPVVVKNTELVFPFVLSILAYLFVHVNYNIYYIDDAWVLSNIWNITTLGVGEDRVFIEPGAAGFVQYFGTTYAFFAGHFLNLFGWTKSNAFILNSIFVWTTALVWFQILRQLPFSKNIAKLTLVFLPIFPPFFFAAHCGRPEAFIGLIISLQFLLFIRRRYFLAAFLTGLAFEAHIMGAVGIFFLIAYAIYRKEEFLTDGKLLKQLIVSFVLGGIAAISYYFILHGNHFSLAELSGLISENRDMGSPLNNYILNYFMNYDWYSRIWEFALFLFCIILFLKKGMYKENRFLTILLIVVLVSTIITRRENKNYFVYIFPAFILMYFYTFERLRQLKKFIPALTIAMGLYYGLHFYFNSSYNFEKIILETKNELDDKTLPVVGVPDFWFASMDRNFIPIHHRQESNLHALDEFYLIQSDYLEWRCKSYENTMNYYREHYNATLVKEIPAFEDKKIQIWKCDKEERFSSKLTKPQWSRH